MDSKVSYPPNIQQVYRKHLLTACVEACCLIACLSASQNRSAARTFHGVLLRFGPRVAFFCLNFFFNAWASGLQQQRRVQQSSPRYKNKSQTGET